MPHYRQEGKFLIDPDKYEGWFSEDFKQAVMIPTHKSQAKSAGVDQNVDQDTKKGLK